MRNFKIILLFLAITVFYFAPVIFSQNTVLSRDIYLFYHPQHSFSAAHMKTGTIPLWNPYLACGKPFQANVQSSLFYPLSSIYYVLPFELGYKYFMVIHYFLASLGMFLLMREWRYSVYGALVSAVVFAYGGYLVSILDNVCFLAAAVWLPFILLCYHRCLQTGSLTASLLAGVGIALQIFAGDASFYVLTTLLSLLFYTLLWPVIRMPSGATNTPWLPWGFLTVAFVTGATVASVQLLPLFELASHSTRFGGLHFAEATKWSFHPAEFLQLISPYIFGTTVPQMRWFGQTWLDTIYVGIFPLLFSMVFVCCCKERRRYFILLLLLFSLLMSMGCYTPLFRILYELLPGLNMLQYPVKFLFPAAFCCSIMAGAGGAFWFARLEADDGGNGIFRAVAGIFVVLIILLVGGGMFQDTLYKYFLTLYPQSEYFNHIQDQSFQCIVNGVALAVALYALFLIITGLLRKKVIRTSLAMTVSFLIILFDLTYIGRPQDPLIPASLITRRPATASVFKPQEPAARIFSLFYVINQQSFLHVYNIPFARLYQTFQEQQRPNLNMYVHLPSVDEYSDVLIRQYYTIFSAVRESFASEVGLSPADRVYRNNMLNLLNVKYLISPFPLTDANVKLLRDGPIKIYENTTCLPRAFFVNRVVVVETEEELLRRLKAPDFDPQSTAYITQSEMKKLGRAIPPIHFPEQSDTLEIIAYQPNQIELKAAPHRACFLFMSDNYYPGWKAYVNGEEQPLVKTNYAFRGLFLDKGEQRITLMFKPRTFIVGAWFSLIAVVCVLGIIVLLRRNQ